MLGESLSPARIPYDAAGRDWDAWLGTHPLPTNAALDARLADATTRAGFVAVCRERGIYHLPTVEFVVALARTLRRLPGPWLEVGAGRGDLAWAVRGAGVPIVATDDGSWWPAPLPDDVIRCDLHAALARFQPATVLCVWPPRGTDWPAMFRSCASVQAYLLIGDGSRGMTGNPATWAGDKGWRRHPLPRLAALGRCRLDAEGASHTHALLVRRSSRRSYGLAAVMVASGDDDSATGAW